MNVRLDGTTTSGLGPGHVRSHGQSRTGIAILERRRELFRLDRASTRSRRVKALTPRLSSPRTLIDCLLLLLVPAFLWSALLPFLLLLQQTQTTRSSKKSKESSYPKKKAQQQSEKLVSE